MGGYSRKQGKSRWAEWGDTPSNWETQETGKMTAGRSGGILQEKSENGVRADWRDTPGNTQNDGGGSAGGVGGGGAPENSGKMEIRQNALRAEWGDT